MINLDLPDLEHDWKTVRVGGHWYWECPVCAVMRIDLPNDPNCPEKVLAWGLQMRAAGAEVERSAIVRHLIDRAEDVRDTPACYDFTNQLATEIESLEHKEEN